MNNQSAPLLVLGAGGLAIAGGFKRDGRWPSNGTASVVASLLLAVAVSLLIGTKARPLVAALVWLYVLVAFYSFVAPKRRK